jgi:sugar phosphate isomerase/epimerase
MFRLCAFADEISPDLDEQIRVCRACRVTHLELRSVDKVNVLDFTHPQCVQIRRKLEQAGLGVAAIGSPVGKVRINEPWPEHSDRFRIAVDRAQFFGAKLVRIFSYYPAAGRDIRAHRDEVMRRMQAKVEFLEQQHVDITLVHENEANIFGERGAACLDLMQTINSPRLRCAFDFANFVVCGERPLDAWPSLKPFTAHVHVKDAVLGSGRIVPAGEGDGQIAPILSDLHRSGYEGFLSLEPHLAKAEQFSGFSGPELFTRAADALKSLCQRNDLPIALGPES